MKKFAIAGLMAMTLLACGQKRTEAALAAQKAEMENEQLRDSISLANQIKEEEKAELEEKEARIDAAASRRSQYATGAAQQASAPVAEQERKKWSNKAKGALIGAGVGAITGAAVSKDKKGKGAIIGGVVGAGVGLGTGAVLDNKAKKEAEGN